MAKVDIKMPEEFLLKLSKLEENSDGISERVLQAGGEVVLDKVKSSLSAVVGRDTKSPSRSTGELEQALGLSPARMDREGNFNVKIGFSEPRKAAAAMPNLQTFWNTESTVSLRSLS